MPRADRRRGSAAPLLGLVVLVAVFAVLIKVVMALVDGSSPIQVPVAEQCTVTVGDVSDSLDLDASENAAVIVAEGMRRGLEPRAASIALATAMQESKLHNIDYGDRDSVGLFQQRPSQGWGTVEQIMDPWYSAGKFYDELVKVPGWQSGDINDVAQTVQRSGVPDGYRKHVEVAKVWASALTGHSPASISCVNRSTATPAPAVARTVVTKALGSSVTLTTGQAAVTVNSSDPTSLWAATHLFMMMSKDAGYQAVAVGQQMWTMNPKELARWVGSATPKPTEATITLRA